MPNDIKHKVTLTTDEYNIRNLVEKARQGHRVRLLGIGNSMLPFLEGGRDYIDLIAVDQDRKPCKKDIVFYKSYDNQYVTHRIYSATEEGCYLIGDGNLSIEPLVSWENIYLKAIGFIRKGKYISASSKGYQFYTALWMKLYPIRIHLLRLYHRINKIAGILKKGKKMKIKEDLMIRNINEDWIVIPMGERLKEFNGMIKTNQSGSFIWRLLEVQKSREEIIADMLEEYDINEETAIHEYDTFIQLLKEANILEA